MSLSRQDRPGTVEHHENPEQAGILQLLSKIDGASRIFSRALVCVVPSAVLEDPTQQSNDSWT